MSKRVFLSYKRNTALDQPLAQRLHQALQQAGHQVFIDQGMEVGENWARRIKTELEAADCLVLLLSEHSVQSEMVAEEARIAVERFKASGEVQPRILPVRVAFAGALPYHLGGWLNALQYAQWHSPADDAALLAQLRRAIEQQTGFEAPAPQAQGPGGLQSSPPHRLPSALPSGLPLGAADVRRELEAPEGTMSAESPFYVPRLCDRTADDATRHGAFTLTIQGPRQCGKSSLLVRVMRRQRVHGARVAFVDFQGFGSAERKNPEQLYYQFCLQLEDELHIEPSQIDDHWDARRSLPQRCTRFMERVILPVCGADGLLLAIDEADSLLDSPACSDFFGMLRSWHNKRATEVAEGALWGRLSIAMVISSEPHLLIAELAQSPFNVGVVIKPEDFNADEVRQSHQAHGGTLSEPQLQQLHHLLGGHPYLTRKALYVLSQGRHSWPSLLAEATAESGPFGDHLRAILARLQADPRMPAALRQALHTGQADAQARNRLIAGGLLKDPSGKLEARNPVYGQYLQKAL